jgi:hypothetical protein
VLKNGALFESDSKIWKISGFINEVIKDKDDDDTSNHVPLDSKVSLEYLIKVVDFLNIYKDNPNSWIDIEKPIKRTNVYDIVPLIYAEYINEMTEEEVIKLVSVADYLDITPLIDLASVKISTLLKPHYDNGCKEEVQRILGINME